MDESPRLIVHGLKYIFQRRSEMLKRSRGRNPNEVAFIVSLDLDNELPLMVWANVTVLYPHRLRT